MSSIERYDAVVVGSGHNGLAAAITLARRGWSVLVVEGAPRPGGAVLTEELTLPGFRHDVFSAVHPASAASPVFADMPLERHGLRWVQPEVAMAHPLLDGRAGALYQDVQRTVDSLERLKPGDGRGWYRLVEPYLRHFPAVRSTVLGGFPPLAGGARLVAALGLGGVLEFARLLLVPAEALARELFNGDHAAAWLTGSALHADVAPAEAGSAITAVYLHLLGHVVGWPSPQGGAGALSGALVGYLNELGGQLRTGVRVERVLTSRNRVAGVGLADGSRVRANAVVADVTPQGLLRIAGHALDPDYRHKLARFRYGPATVKLDWALSSPIPWAAEEARAAGTVHIGGTAQELSQAFAAIRIGELPKRPFCLFGQQSLADPTRAPAGNHTAWAYTRVPPSIDWPREREGFLERLENQIDRFAPGFRDHVLARSVLDPQTLQQRDPNLPNGDVGSGTYQLDQLVFRPIPSLSPYRTPIAGLYIGSAAVFPGGAVHGVPGRAAARVALAEAPLVRLR